MRLAHQLVVQGRRLVVRAHHPRLLVLILGIDAIREESAYLLVWAH
jgi:hypothetical protein